MNPKLEGLEFASLSPKEEEKLKESEEALNHQHRKEKQEEVYLLAFKRTHD